MEQRVSKALKRVARGMSLRGAANGESAPYSGVRDAWKALGGDVDGPAWQAYRESLPPLPAEDPAAAPAAAADESPLGPRLKRKADRFGDGIPYGQHGSWGMFREGVKEMTDKISTGKVSPHEAHQQLAAVGVHVTEESLRKKARAAPGKSPVKGGVPPKLPWKLQREVHEQIVFFRKHDLPVTKPMIQTMMLAKLTDSEQERDFPKGISDEVYYSFLDRFDMNTEETKPLESDRDLWLTSKV